MSILILILGAVATFFVVTLIETGRIGYDRGYDEGLEDGIRMTNEVLEEDMKDEPQTKETEMERLERIDNELEDAWARIRELTDEPQTDCPWR